MDANNNVKRYMHDIFTFEDRKRGETLYEIAQRHVLLVSVTADASDVGTQLVNYYGLLEMTKVRGYYLPSYNNYITI